MAEEHEGGGLLQKKLFGLPAPVVLGGGALVAWFVLAHRTSAPSGAVDQTPSGPQGLAGAGGSPAAESLQDQQQREQLGYQTALDALRLEAARFGLTQQEQAYNQQAQALGGGTAVGTDHGKTRYSYGTGAVSKAWQQVNVGGQSLWEDIYHPGHIINEQQAQQLSSKNSGPYAKGQGGFFGEAWKFIQSGLGVYARSQGIPVGLPSARQPTAAEPALPSVPATPRYTPPFALQKANRRDLG
jgi:hypothetical protein